MKAKPLCEGLQQDNDLLRGLAGESLSFPPGSTDQKRTSFLGVLLEQTDQ
jgi:hypothetical protein